METARALGNLSRHADARKCMASLRLDEILVPWHALLVRPAGACWWWLDGLRYWDGLIVCEMGMAEMTDTLVVGSIGEKIHQ